MMRNLAFAASLFRHSVQQESMVGIALGLRVTEPGYSLLGEAIDALGPSRRMHEAFWMVQTGLAPRKVFEHLNTHLLDRRIASHAGILVLDADAGKARWHWDEPVTSALSCTWHRRTNLFLSLDLTARNDPMRAAASYLRALGLCVPLNERLWYVSTDFSLQDAYQVLLLQTAGACNLLMCDALGNIAGWQHRDSLRSVFERSEPEAPELRKARLDREPIRFDPVAPESTPADLTDSR